MKHLRGYGKRYFSLAIIAMYSTLNKLSKADSNFQYHLKAFEYLPLAQAPPYPNFNN
ncbi:MAG: hypothetical protein U9N59_15795 [Campylobacterota bacterium]|nr:hypothetical protein [Campylobacterota bacterium]